MCSCYILYSKTLRKFYIGSTHTSVSERLFKHNEHLYGKHRFTAKADDWEIYLDIRVNDFSHAVRLERKIKSMKSAVYIRNLKQYPELVKKLIQETST
jgi:putative endonuclease